MTFMLSIRSLWPSNGFWHSTWKSTDMFDMAELTGAIKEK